MNLTRISPPAVAPVSLAEVKAALAVVGDHDDTLLTRLIASATAAFDGPDGKLGRCLITQTWRMDLAEFPMAIPMPMAPRDVTNVSYVAAGNVVTLDPERYFRAGDTLFPTPRWPSGRAVAVTFTAGYGDDPEDIPEDIRQAIIATIGSAYAWREAQVLASTSLQANPETQDIVDRHRLRGFG